MPPVNLPTLTVTPLFVVGDLLRAIDEAGERPDGVDAVGVVVAGVGGLAVGDDGDPAGPFAPRDDLIVDAARFEDERARGAARAVEDEGRPSGEPISSSATERRDRAAWQDAGGLERTERVADDDQAALHVEDAGAAEERAVLPEAGEGRLREDGVVVADEQDRVALGGGVWNETWAPYFPLAEGTTPPASASPTSARVCRRPAFGRAGHTVEIGGVRRVFDQLGEMVAPSPAASSRAIERRVQRLHGGDTTRFRPGARLASTKSSRNVLSPYCGKKTVSTLPRRATTSPSPNSGWRTSGRALVARRQRIAAAARGRRGVAEVAGEDAHAAHRRLAVAHHAFEAAAIFGAADT